MSNNVRFDSTIPPADNDMNGLDSITQELIDDPMTARVVLLLVNAPKSIVNAEAGTTLPKLNIIRAEPVGTLGEVAKELRDQFLKSAEKRTGKTPLPLDTVEVVQQGPISDAEAGS